LVSHKFKTELLILSDNSTTREAITKAQLEEFKIPLPTLAEQQKIVSQITEIETKIAALENQIAAIPQQKESILKKYL
jgi:restriction endonuclease S subunit